MRALARGGPAHGHRHLRHGSVRVTRLVTPVGELRTTREQVDDYARTVYLTGHPVKTPDDLRAWRWLLEDTRCEPCYEDWLTADRAVRDDGIDMANLPDSPLHRIFVTMMGYEVGSLAFADSPREMDDLCRLIFAKNEEAYALAMTSPARHGPARSPSTGASPRTCSSAR